MERGERFRTHSTTCMTAGGCRLQAATMHKAAPTGAVVLNSLGAAAARNAATNASAAADEPISSEDEEISDLD